MVVNKSPVYPITVKYIREKEEVTFDNEFEMVTYLEFFDSHDPEEDIEVKDALCRTIKLIIWGLEIKKFEVEDGSETAPN
jgi:DNA-directed RNA polymerase subunit F